eukprot:882850-Pelagomonas_calceolata.AAC.1
MSRIARFHENAHADTHIHRRGMLACANGGISARLTGRPSISARPHRQTRFVDVALPMLATPMFPFVFCICELRGVPQVNIPAAMLSICCCCYTRTG